MRSWFRERKMKNWVTLVLISFGFLLVLFLLYARFLQERESSAQGHYEDNVHRPIKVMTPVASPSSAGLATEKFALFPDYLRRSFYLLEGVFRAEAESYA